MIVTSEDSTTSFRYGKCHLLQREKVFCRGPYNDPGIFSPYELVTETWFTDTQILKRMYSTGNNLGSLVFPLVRVIVR